MDWRTYAILFAIFLFAVVLDTWTPFGPAPHYWVKVALRIFIVIIGLYWILCGLGILSR
jgi:hypothetical protein